MSTEPDYVAEEAAKLMAIYRQRKKVDRSLTQEKIADACEWSGQSTVSQYLNGKIPLNLPALMKFATILDFSLEEVSPRLAAIVDTKEKRDGNLTLREGSQGQYALEAKAEASLDLTPFEVWDDETPLGDDEVELPFFKEVELSAGKGSEVMLETHGRKLRFGKRTLQKKGIAPDSAACATVYGNSMEPVLPNGSTVGVDKSSTQVQDGQMYAIEHDGQLRVKVLYRLPGGGLRLRSYNIDEHPDERYDAEYVKDKIRVIGRVFWYSVLL